MAGGGAARGGRDSSNAGRRRQADVARGHGVYALARSGGEATGTLDARALPRLRDLVLQDESAPIAYTIRGTTDALGHPALEISISGSVRVACQRCLRAMTVQLDRRTLLLVASNEAELEAWDRDEAEVALADESTDAAALVEDEMLLTLPFSPRHEEPGCAPAGDDLAPAA
jgi:uncharacterized protein